MLPFGRRRGAGWIPANGFLRQITAAGVDQRAAGIVGVIERTWARGMSGTGGGRIVAGEPSSPGYKFAGYMNYQTLAVASLSPLGQSTNLRASPNVALPATSGEVVQAATPRTVADSLALIPPGVR